MVFRLLLAFLLAQQPVIAQQPVPAREPVAAPLPVIAHHPNHIDSLTTTDLVLAYVGKLTGHESETLQPTPGKKLFDKADLDNNGYTDLLFNGDGGSGSDLARVTLVVLSFPGDSIVVRRLPDEYFYDSFAVNIVKLDGQPYIHAYQVTRKFRDSWSLKKNKPIRKDYTEYRSDTLTWRQNALLEIAPRVEHKIDSITYALVGGFTIKGGFRLTIKQDSLLLEKEKDWLDTMNFGGGGIFIGRLDTAAHNRLYTLLECIDFPHLENDYSMSGSDASTGVLNISYDNGRKKRIIDYGARGTYALTALQNLLIGLLETQQWVQVSKEDVLIDESLVVEDP